MPGGKRVDGVRAMSELWLVLSRIEGEGVSEEVGWGGAHAGEDSLCGQTAGLTYFASGSAFPPSFACVTSLQHVTLEWFAAASAGMGMSNRFNRAVSSSSSPSLSHLHEPGEHRNAKVALDVEATTYSDKIGGAKAPVEDDGRNKKTTDLQDHWVDHLI